MPVTLRPEQRDALFSQISVDLGLIGDLQVAMSRGDEKERYRLGQRVGEALRLVIEGGLGWKERTAEPTVLKFPDEEIRPTVTRMQQDVAPFQGMGATILRPRERAGISCADLAKKIGSRESDMERIERGEVDADWATLRFLAREFKLPLGRSH